MIKLVDILNEAFNLQHTTRKVRKQVEKDIRNLSDDLTLQLHPVGGVVARVTTRQNPDDYAELKRAENRYFFSIKMDQPIKAGKALKALLDIVPSGAIIGEKSGKNIGSLSTDSFYTLVRKAGQLDKLAGKDAYEPKVDGYANLNSHGKKRYRDEAEKATNANLDQQELLFQSEQDALELIKAINADIEKAGIREKAKIKQTNDGSFGISVPNIVVVKK